MDPLLVYRRRRDELMRRIGPRAVALVHGGRPPRRNATNEHRYRAPSDLLYLTGFGEPEACAVIAPGRAERYTMLLRAKDPEREVWTGRRLGVEAAPAALGADQAFPAEMLREKLRALVDGAEELHYYPGDDAEIDRLVLDVIAELRAGERRGLRAPRRIVDLRATLHEMRLVKDESEIELLRRAVAITAEAHTAAMRGARPGMHEYEVEALVEYTFRRRGATGPGYTTIVGGGDNANILHYIENDAPLAPGALLLIDAGAEYRGYTADVTRTFPPGGRFSEAQRRVYEVVLEAQKACVAAVAPGADIDSIHQLALRKLTEGMVRLGLLGGSVDQLLQSEAYKRFYMHRTSHWLGLDVHDAGIYYPAQSARPLVPGMVLTVEPGLYIAADARDVPEPLRGIGVRIEDDVLVTPTGHEVLTRAIPKDPTEIEQLTAAG